MNTKRHTQIVSLTWYPYPEFAPPQDDLYIITGDWGGVPYAYYSSEDGAFNCNMDDVWDEVIPIAWSYLPESYKEDK